MRILFRKFKSWCSNLGAIFELRLAWRTNVSFKGWHVVTVASVSQWSKTTFPSMCHCIPERLLDQYNSILKGVKLISWVAASGRPLQNSAGQWHPPMVLGSENLIATALEFSAPWQNSSFSIACFFYVNMSYRKFGFLHDRQSFHVLTIITPPWLVQDEETISRRLAFIIGFVSSHTYLHEWDKHCFLKLTILRLLR